MSVRANITSGQSSRPIMGIVQDCLVGSYLMTQGWVDIQVTRFHDICVAAKLDTNRFSHIERVYKSYYPSLTKERLEQYITDHKIDTSDVVEMERAAHFSSLLYTGRGLLSLTLPVYFFYNLNNKANPSQPVLRVRNGVIVEGTIDKSAVGPKSGAMHHFMTPENGLSFLTKFQHIVNNWLRDEGFGVGVADCFPEGADATGMLPSVKLAIEKAFNRARTVETTQSNPLIAEIKINSALNAARDISSTEIKKEIRSGNRFYPLIHSGSKGSMTNMTQILRFLGQQNVEGKRLQPSCIDGVRTLPHYREVEKDPVRAFESGGFIRHSFFNGLNPQEFWAHASSGREGIINTAVSTARTGYCQRRITEMLKNVTVEYDCSVRDSNGRIIQFIYGGDGLSPSKQQRFEGQLQCHIGTKIEEINAAFESKCFEDGIRMEDFQEPIQGLTIVVPDSCDGPELPSPINSAGDDDDVPESPGSVGSFDNDYDE